MISIAGDWGAMGGAFRFSQVSYNSRALTHLGLIELLLIS